MGSYLVLLDFLPTASESKYIKFAGRAKAANPEREYAEERNFAHFQSISQTNTGNSRLRTTSEKLVQHADGYQPFSAWLTSRPKYLYSEPPKPVKINNGPSPTRCDIVSRSSLYAPECSAPGSMEKPRPLLITGTGRVGTTYVQKLLFSLGLDIRHDAHDDPSCFNSQHCGLQGAVSWVHLYTDAGFQLAPKKSSDEQKVKRQSNNLSMAFPDQIYTENAEDNLVRYCKLPKWSWSPSGQRFRVVVHLVRDPLKSIQSRSNMNRRSIEWIGTYVACVTDILPQYVLDQKDLSRPVHWADAAREMFHHLPVSAAGGDRSTLHTSNLKLLVSLRHFITWNSFAENIAQLRWRIEDFGYSSIEKLCAILPSLWGSRGCPSSKTFRVIQAKLKNDTNHDHGK